MHHHIVSHSQRPPPSWAEAEAQSAFITDSLGKPIDNEIRHAVVALRANAFETTGSCAGHLQWGEPAPWIEIGVTPRLNRRTELRQRTHNLNQQRRFIRVLNSFYQHRSVPADMRLVVLPFGVAGGFRITNQGAEVQAVLSTHARRIKLRQFQSEFDALYQFLYRSPLTVIKPPRRVRPRQTQSLPRRRTRP